MPRIFKKHDIYQGHLLISFGGEEIRSLWYVTLDHNMADRHSRTGPCSNAEGQTKGKLEIAQSEQDVSPFCKESYMT